MLLVQGYLFPIFHQRRMNMEKQMALFQMEDKDESNIWTQLPEKSQRKIEKLFSRLLIKHLTSSSEEVKNHEK